MNVQAKPLWHLLQACALVALSASFANAQTTTSKTTTPTPPVQAASGTASLAEPTAKKHSPTGRSGRYFTPGWSLMSAEERKEHQEHMNNIKSEDECRTYLEQHHEKMAARAKEKNGKALAKPWRDACGSFKKK